LPLTTTNILGHALRKDKITQRRLLVIQRRLTLQQVAVSPGHAQVKRIEIMPDPTVLAFGAITRRIAVGRYRVRGSDCRTEKGKYQNRYSA
jgi:hypothetical protein